MLGIELVYFMFLSLLYLHTFFIWVATCYKKYILYVSSYFSKDSEMFMKTQLMVGRSPEIFFPPNLFHIYDFSKFIKYYSKNKKWKRNLPSESIFPWNCRYPKSGFWVPHMSLNRPCIFPHWRKSFNWRIEWLSSIFSHKLFQ